MPARPPKISCMMPTYGRPAYVHEAVWTFLRQDDPNKELIVLNDCPGQIYEFNHPEVRVFNESERFGTLGEKRNRCIELAEGDLVAVWDDDDVSLPWRLSYCRAERERRGVSFYRAAEFLAYWGENWLHDNQTVPGWCSHPTTLFAKELWRSVGGYPAQGVGEDAVFFQRVHERLGEEHIVHPIAPDDRFLILRGKSRYPHMSHAGGQGALDTTPGRIRIEPQPIADPLLYSHYVDRVARRGAPAEGPAIVGRGGPTGRPALSVLISLLNRSRIVDGGEELALFPHCVRSIAGAAAELAAADGIGPIELVVADFYSDDRPILEWLPEAAGPLAWTLVPVGGAFSRGRGLNRAAAVAAAERLLLCDADLLLTPEILRRAIDVVEEGGVWSPIFQYLTREGEPAYWEDRAHGVVAVSRARFAEVGGVPEFESWGGEDDLFYDRLARIGPVVRERAEGLRHQWHPDRLRHVHYRRAPGEDFQDYQRACPATAGPGAGSGTGGTYYGVHPHWAGELTLFADGRFVRAGAHAGGYEQVPGRSLVLAWDDWPAERLEWNPERGLFQSPDAAFTLRRQSAAPTPHAPVSR
ncbi:glycosyltransferase family 2 protein [Alienimonas californiensis]|uniref:Putative glycosyl transferase n=1 Tax=Alienimonas californiensis TaxID=2527989 RepID=A0A517P4F5_9PLAN|nr:glycosyltransferase family 2 protein [Alienimonas californiensis]QDT14241.1 putative glycosyl transferase [Alienimonas californiensis]